MRQSQNRCTGAIQHKKLWHGATNCNNCDTWELLPYVTVAPPAEVTPAPGLPTIVPPAQPAVFVPPAAFVAFGPPAQPAEFVPPAETTEAGPEPREPPLAPPLEPHPEVQLEQRVSTLEDSANGHGVALAAATERVVHLEHTVTELRATVAALQETLQAAMSTLQDRRSGASSGSSSALDEEAWSDAAAAPAPDSQPAGPDSHYDKRCNAYVSLLRQCERRTVTTLLSRRTSRINLGAQNAPVL